MPTDVKRRPRSEKPGYRRGWHNVAQSPAPSAPGSRQAFYDHAARRLADPTLAAYKKYRTASMGGLGQRSAQDCKLRTPRHKRRSLKKAVANLQGFRGNGT